MKAAILEMLQQGVALQQSGNVDDAAPFYLRVLECDPSASDAWHLMGRVWLARKDFAAAAGCVARAIQLRADLPAYHCALGDILAAQGLSPQAMLCYQESLRLDPRFVPAWVNVGLACRAQGQLRESCAAFARAIEIDPASAEALNDLGNTLAALGSLEDAAQCFREAFRQHPDQPIAAVNLAACLLRQQRPWDAEQWARRALELQPGMTEALSNLVTALLGEERYGEAERMARQAVAQAPGRAHLHCNLATVLLEQKRFEEAERECRTALNLEPGHREVRLNLGVILQRAGRLEEAAAVLQQLIDDDPRNADAWTNLGTVRADQGRHEEALFCPEEALRLQPSHAKAHFCRSLEIMARGRLQEGFAEYEWRWKVVRPGRAAAGKAWNGAPLGGRTILLHSEQGLGDTLQFARYIPRVAARGGRVIVESQPAAAPIVRSVSGVSQVFVAQDPLPPFDFQAPLLSLPRILGITLESIPHDTPYVSFDRERAARIEARLGSCRGLRIGLAWAGNPDNGGDHRRSMPLDTFSALRSVGGAEWFSLHIGDKARAAVRAAGGWVREVLNDDGGLVELAALMSCLDLVISVDTMAVHLAGALGRPVWNLLCAAPDWRWLREGETTPWYPTMRLFRQARLGDWDEVMERVAQELGDFSPQPTSGAIRYGELKAGEQSAFGPASRLTA